MPPSLGRSGLAIAAVAAGIALAVARNRVRRFEIAEQSMEPSLSPGDYVIAVRRSGPARRGDVVVYEAPHRPGFDVVKRVVGLGGERIAISGGQVHVDGSPLAEPWADGSTFPDGDWELARDEIFVLGDRRANSSLDSRDIGPLRDRSAAWFVVWRYWRSFGPI